MDDSPSQVLVRLNVYDNLLNIREELKNNDMIEMNHTLSFAKKESDGLSEINVLDEESINLYDILDGNVLHLVKSSKCNWKFLHGKFHLEYGLYITSDGIKKAKKKAFIMKDWKNCEMTEIGAEGCRKGTFEFNSNEYWGMKSNILFTGNINVRDYVNLGVSVENLQNKNEMNSTYSYKEIGKLSLEFSKCFEPTSEFINVVENAIKSGEPNELKQITKEYGQFIPDEVILGGRVYSKGTQISKKLTKENDHESVANQQALNIGVGNRSENLRGNTNYCKRECTKLIGGEQPDSLEEFDETAWIRSLKDFRNWDCIEYKNPISIFQLLPNNFHRRIFSLIGKKIHYSKIEDITYELKEFGKPQVFKLDIPPKISKIVQNKKTDCNIFATVLDTDENDDFFNYQIFHPPKGIPSLIIHCVQKRFRKRECRLRIGWMIVGYHTDFNSIFTDSNIQLKVLKSNFNASGYQIFSMNLLYSGDFEDFEEFEYRKGLSCIGIPVLSKLDSSSNSLVIGHFFNIQENKIRACIFSYCLKTKCYVKLPEFTFYVLFINSFSVGCNLLPLEFSIFKKEPFIDLRMKSVTYHNPGYISLCLSSNDYDFKPFFLKQELNHIKIKKEHQK
ncbi:unnamed protein product [Rhizophagus irregularis]|nr:unnamed protein product [Rhizophagus irregularis]